MRWWVQAIAGLFLVATSTVTWAQTPEGWDRYLNRPRGPYRGQVIDADTRAPLVGAVVVAYWPRDRIFPFHSVMEHYAVREVLTDADGRFVINSEEIEERAPKLTLYPSFLIFMPGYGAFPRLQKAPTGFTGGIFEGSGAVVELRRLEDREDRRRNLRAIPPNSFTDTPFTDLPNLMKRINEERGFLGLLPFSPAEGR